MSENINYKQLIPKLMNDARRGDAKAQYHLGVLYQDGKVVPKDYIQAAKYYTQAAAKGHAKAQLYLGLLYQNGKGFPKNYKQAAFLYSQAAAQGNEKAMYYLGMLHYYGKGTDKNLNEAFKWLTESASRGYPEAQKVIDEILAATRDEIAQEISQEPKQKTDSQVQEPKPEITAKHHEANDAFRKALAEQDDGNNNASQNDVPKAKPESKKSRVYKIFALITFALTATAIFMYFRNSRAINVPENNVLSLGEPVEIPVTQQNSTPPTRFDPDSEIFDVYGLAANGNLTQLQSAAANGANFNKVNDDGETPLHTAASHNKHTDTVKFLIDQGLDVNAERIKGTGETPLAFAVIHNNVEAVRVLLLCGANVNLNIPGKSLLSIAVKNDSPEVVNLLLDAKVSPNIRDENNKLPIDYANELPPNSLLKNSPVFDRLQSSSSSPDEPTETPVSKQPEKQSESDKNKIVQRAVRENRIPDYIFKRGKFSFNPYAEKLSVTGSGVRFRSEPNTKSKIKTGLNKGQILEYYGEWISPAGERWVLGLAKNSDSDFGWIYGQYTQLISPNSN